jgi:Mrp family chromosome partitioning ATPase
MKAIPIEDQFDLLRAKLEGAVKTSAVIVVSSACAGDGESATAFGLAKSFASSGYSTLLIDSNYLNPTVAQDRAPLSLEAIATNGPRSFARPAFDGPYATISLVKESLRRNASRPALSRALDACRESYQVIVVDAGPIVDSNIGMMLAKLADGILLSVREGRSIKRADHEVVRSIEMHELPVLGSVTISKTTIRDFKNALDRPPVGVAAFPAADGAASRQRSSAVV